MCVKLYARHIVWAVAKALLGQKPSALQKLWQLGITWVVRSSHRNFVMSHNSLKSWRAAAIHVISQTLSKEHAYMSAWWNCAPLELAATSVVNFNRLGCFWTVSATFFLVCAHCAKSPSRVSTLRPDQLVHQLNVCTALVLLSLLFSCKSIKSVFS